MKRPSGVGGWKERDENQALPRICISAKCRLSLNSKHDMYMATLHSQNRRFATLIANYGCLITLIIAALLLTSKVPS